jgi:2-polyprenyl-3-methyl-5-hydroxy-6-metoxy-1,4-benzoquinol methylase
MFQLEKMGYAFDETHRIWVRPGYGGIDYNDGDTTERRLARIVSQAGDVSVFSPELRRHCKSWAKLYHLSAQRGNVLRPFEDLLEGNILEIGAGCGAISRYLGEAGGRILALEGSPRRAAITASRTRDLPNVTVLAERFDDFNCDDLFDAITLIGVLEYAGMFSDGNAPALNMLQRVRRMLKLNGRLFIAIENQLGLKYFAGAQEDHIGRAMYGIEGRYQHGQPQTYGRQTLANLVSAAGFACIEFLAPFPDYKLPKSILTEQGCAAKDFDAAAFAWQSIKADPQLPATPHFDLMRTWSTVFGNGLGLELSNSFIVVASQTKQRAVAEQVLAFHYSTDRKAAFCKETRFVRGTTDNIIVRYRLLAKKVEAGSAEYELVLPEKDVYRRGRLLSETFIEVFSTPGWTIARAAELVKSYLQYLRVLLKAHGHDEVDLNSLNCRLPGAFIDAIPQNIIVSPDGSPQLIDMEWRARREIELGHLLFRLLTHLAGIFAPLDEVQGISRKEFMESLFAAAGIPAGNGDLARYSAREAEFQLEVNGTGMKWHPHHSLVRSKVRAGSLRNSCRRFQRKISERLRRAKARLSSKTRA